MSARKIGFLILLLGAGAAIEAAWQLRGDIRIGPEGCRVIRGRFYGPSYSFDATQERAVAEAPRLEVRNAFGGVTVRPGGPGSVKVRLRKVVFLPTEERARAFSERVELRLQGEGQLVRVTTNRDELGRADDVGFETHLEIEAPPETTVEVRNEHGRVDLTGLAAADVVSSFDGVSVERLAGGLKLEAGHGGVRVDGVGAGLELHARHGDVEISDVAGASRIEVEHGDLTARETAALDVGIQYGQLEAAAVAGDLVVRGGRAGLRASDVQGRAEVETSYGAIHLARVAGNVRASARHGEVTAEDVGGELHAEATHARVAVDRVDGPVLLVAERGEVKAGGLARGGTVRTTSGDVTLDGFAGPMEVEVERGSARLSPRAPIVSPITVSATQGEIQLKVPEGSRFSLEAESGRGELRGDVPGLSMRETGDDRGRGRRAAGELSGGGGAVRLRSDGDVVLEAQPAGPVADRPVAKPAPAERRPVEAAPAAPAPPSGPEAPTPPTPR